MTVAKTVLMLTDANAVVKVAGSGAAAIIDLQTDLLKSNEVLDGATQKVDISGFQWTGDSAGVITIARDGTTIATLLASAAGALEMNGQMMMPDPIQNDKDITVTISGGQAECWIRLHKVSGYASKVEPGLYGSYDDPTRIGASTTISGSPHKV